MSWFGLDLYRVSLGLLLNLPFALELLDFLAMCQLLDLLLQGREPFCLNLARFARLAVREARLLAFLTCSISEQRVSYE